MLRKIFLLISLMAISLNAQFLRDVNEWEDALNLFNINGIDYLNNQELSSGSFMINYYSNEAMSDDSKYFDNDYFLYVDGKLTDYYKYAPNLGAAFYKAKLYYNENQQLDSVVFKGEGEFADENNKKYQFRYFLNYLLRVDIIDSSGSNYYFEYEYAEGKISKISQRSENSSNWSELQFFYNAEGQLEKNVSLYKGTSFKRVMLASYSNGSLIEKIYTNNEEDNESEYKHKKEFSYDSEGNLSNYKFHMDMNSNDKKTIDVSYQYDENNKLQKAVNNIDDSYLEWKSAQYKADEKDEIKVVYPQAGMQIDIEESFRVSWFIKSFDPVKDIELFLSNEEGNLKIGESYSDRNEAVLFIDTLLPNINNIIISVNNDEFVDSLDGSFLVSNYYSKLLGSALLEVNGFDVPLNGSGVLADVNSDLFESGLRFDDKMMMFSGGFFMSGYDQEGNLWANGEASASLVDDYIPGKVGSYNDKNLFLLNSSDSAFGSSWQIYRDAVSLGAPFIDGDNDGEYNPVDLNSNGMWDENEDKPDLMGDYSSYTVFNDGKATEYRTRFEGMQPLGIEIKQQVYGYDAKYNNSLFISYELVNTGLVADTLKDVIFTPYLDVDLGDHVDDLMGSWPNYNAIYFYNKNYDSQHGNEKYTLFFQYIDTDENDGIANTSSSVFYQSDPNFGDPDSHIEARNYMEGFNKSGDVIDPCSFNMGEVKGIDCSNVDSKYIFSGDLLTGQGWFDTYPTDVRGLLNIGKFNLVKDEPVKLVFNMVIGYDESDYIASFRNAKELALQIQEDANAFVGIQEENAVDNIPVSYSLSQNYPNPFNPSTTISFNLPEVSKVKISLYNILGERIAVLTDKEFAAGSQNLKFNANNLPSGIYIYQMEAAPLNGGNSFIISKKMTLLK